jgi:hypothetical protein
MLGGDEESMLFWESRLQSLKCYQILLILFGGDEGSASFPQQMFSDWHCTG